MEKAFRKTGIDIIGDASWGTHLCQFYETREDLVDILVPYFKAGLENNEFCIWITSEPLKVEDAKVALKKVIKNLDHFIIKGQIEIWDYSEWYTKSGKFDANNVLQGWVEKENRALKRGYDGLRLSGNTFWLEEKDWRNFTDYEEEVNRVIGKYRMIAICTYSLAKCGASEVIDVVSNHQFALIRREGKWVIIESSEQKRAEGALRESEERFRRLAEAPFEGIFFHDKGKVIDANEAFATMFGYGLSEVIGKNALDFAAPELREAALSHIRDGSDALYDGVAIRKDGSTFLVEVHGKNASYKGRSIRLTAVRDITERKRAEEVLRESEEKYRSLTKNVNLGIYRNTVGPEGKFIEANPAIIGMFGYKSKEEFLAINVSDLYQNAEDRKKFNDKMLKEGFVKDEELWLKRKDGSLFVGSVSAVAVKDEQGHVKYYDGIIDNITERKRAEEALRESEERYRTVARLSSDFAYSCVYTGDDGYEVDWITDAFFTLTGYSEAELHEQRCWLFVSHPDDREMATKPLHALKAEESDTSEFRIVTKDGRILYIVNYMECHADPEARGGLRLFGAVQDITERKRAEEALRYQAALLANMHDAIIASDEHYRLTAWNAAAESLYGWKTEEVLGRFGLDILQTEFPGVNKSEMLRTIAETGHWSGEVTQARKDGTRIPVEVASIVLHDESGRIAGYVSVNRDITERKRAELEYKAIVGTAMDGFWIIDSQGRFLDTNDAYCGLIGYSREELLKMKISDIEAKEKPKETERHIRKIMEVGGDRFETRHKCKDGRVVDIEVSTKYNKESGDKLYAFLRDVTQRKQMGEALAKYIGELQRLSKQLIAVQEAERLRISQELHDEMGQALTMLRINIASIKESLPPGYAKGIKDRLADADALTEKILGQIHELTLELRPHMLDDLGLVSTVRWYTERLSRRLNIQILFTQKNLKRRLAPEIRTTLFRIIQEALTNVAKHARAKKVRILLAQKQKFIELIIQDDGRGFDQRKIEKRPSRARGIGLFSMKERAALLNGECAIESRPGAGTKVRIRIPWRKAVEKN
jgi:PAS domain S-box-containing protein